MIKGGFIDAPVSHQ